MINFQTNCKLKINLGIVHVYIFFLFWYYIYGHEMKYRGHIVFVLSFHIPTFLMRYFHKLYLCILVKKFLIYAFLTILTVRPFLRENKLCYKKMTSVGAGILCILVALVDEMIAVYKEEGHHCSFFMLYVNKSCSLKC